MCLKSLKGDMEAVVYGDGVCDNWDLEALTEISVRMGLVSLTPERAGSCTLDVRNQSAMILRLHDVLHDILQNLPLFWFAVTNGRQIFCIRLCQNIECLLKKNWSEFYDLKCWDAVFMGSKFIDSWMQIFTTNSELTHYLSPWFCYQVYSSSWLYVGWAVLLCQWHLSCSCVQSSPLPPPYFPLAVGTRCQPKLAPTGSGPWIPVSLPSSSVSTWLCGKTDKRKGLLK